MPGGATYAWMHDVRRQGLQTRAGSLYIFFSFSKEMQGSGKSPQCKISFSKPPLLGLYLFYFVFILFLRGTVFFFSEILNFDPQRFGKPM